MEFELVRNPEFHALRLNGDLRMWNHPKTEAGMIEAFQEGLQEDGPRVFVLNLSGATHIDSRGIGVLTEMLQKVSARQRELRVVLPGGIPGEALRRIGIFRGTKEFADEASATASG